MCKRRDMTHYMVDGILFCGAMLPSVRDMEYVNDKRRKYKGWYWLRNRFKRNDYDVMFVDERGNVDERGFYCYEDEYLYVRPMLDIRWVKNDHYIGEHFIFGGHRFEIVSEERAFCLEDLGIDKFDEDTNVYMESRVRRKLKKWYEKSLKKYVEDYE